MILIGVLLLLLVLAAALYLMFRHYYDKSNYVSDDMFTVYYGEFPAGQKEYSVSLSGSEPGSQDLVSATEEESSREQNPAEETWESEEETQASAEAVSSEELREETKSPEETESRDETESREGADTKEDVKASETEETKAAEETRAAEETEETEEAAEAAEMAEAEETEETAEAEETEEIKETADASENTEKEAEATLARGEEESIREEYEREAGSLQQAREKYVYNLLLIGADSRGGWYGNSDAMILLSVNTKSHKLFLTSFMRDLYADIPQIGVRKLNSAYARGAGPLLTATIEENYKIDINNYASVDFGSMSGIIDLMGGVDIAVSEAEAEVMKIYIDEMGGLYGYLPEDYYVQGGGVIHLNGIQAVAYARVRYVGNADYERTSRQRRVLEQLIAKAKTMDVQTMLQAADQILPLITHNIDPGQMVSLLSSLPEYLTYEVVMDRIPYDGAFSYMGEILVPDFEYTINRLQATIYEGVYAEQMQPRPQKETQQKDRPLYAELAVYRLPKDFTDWRLERLGNLSD